MDHECVRTDGISARYKNTAATTILPEYGCLIVSPANLWKRDPITFQVPFDDSQFCKTTYKIKKLSLTQFSPIVKVLGLVVKY